MKIYQIETTNHCNATCSYCPHSIMKRPKGFISNETFEKCMMLLDNNYVALHHFGEPFLHPNLSNFIKAAHDYMVKVEFSTNGGCTVRARIEDVMDANPYRIRIAYDAFAPIIFIKDVLTYNKDTIVNLHSVDGYLSEKKAFNNFAGAIKRKSEVKGECYFKKYGFVVVLWNGDIVPCCQDYEGKDVLGNVHDKDIEEKIENRLYHNSKKSYSICRKCTGMQFAEGGHWLHG